MADTEKKYVDAAAAQELVTKVEELIDSSSGGGHVSQSTAPSDTSLLWVDTSSGGVLKYYDTTGEAWKACPAAWG